jgi:hypothetical protein
VLKPIPVASGGTNFFIHEIDPRECEVEEPKKYCKLVLCAQHDEYGHTISGKCSRICEHGYMTYTEDFVFRFPFAIEGGGMDASDCKNQEMKR